MFQSKPICILTAGLTVDGRNIEQQVIDDVAETYDPKKYNARINENHPEYPQFVEKFGSVLSVEKRGNQLFAVLKPNSNLIYSIERGQLLHTSCELKPNFAGSGKWYLTGLALTDEPASLGTTEMHLSAKKPDDKDKISLSSGGTISRDAFPHQEKQSQEEQTFISRLMSFIGHEKYHTQESKEEPEMSKELQELIKLSIEQSKATNDQVSALVTALSAKEKAPGTTTPEPEKSTIEIQLEKLTAQVTGVIALSKGEKPTPEKTSVESQIEALSVQISELTTKLSKAGDEQTRTLAGENPDEDFIC